MEGGKEDGRGSHSRKERGLLLTSLNHTYFRKGDLSHLHPVGFNK